MSRSGPGPWLRGRRRECAALDQVLAGISAGHSRVLVLRGEAGIGKTALLEYLADRAGGCRVARAAGVESEMELAFAGMHQLCAPFLDRIDHLPAPQRDALRTAFGLRSGNPPDRFLIGLAVLGLLSDIADDRPLVCLVDDAQWLDQASAQALAFVARRLQAESVALVFATRTVDEDRALAQLPDLPVGGLGDEDSRVLLRGALRGPLDPTAFDELVAEARGNPLALLELPRGRTPAQLAFGFGLPDSMPLASRVEQGFLHRLQPLPAETRKLVLAAAVEPVGDVIVLRRAAARLGLRSDAAAPAEAAGLIELGTRVRFHHPLVRSAAWRSADLADLQEVHRALAAVTVLDPDRRAWHRAQASTGPDEEVAVELEGSAERARSRGGFAAAAAFLARAAELTPDAARKANRVLAAAQAELHAGRFDAALELLAVAAAGPLDQLGLARHALLRARVAFAASRGSEAPPLLLAAAARLEPLDAELARDTYLDAFSAAMFAGRFAGDTDLAAVAAAVPAGAAAGGRADDLLLGGLTAVFTDGYAAAVPVARRVLRAFSVDEDVPVADRLRRLWFASIIAADVWDDESWHALSARHVTLAREAGALGELLLALSSRVIVLLHAGDLEGAEALVDEAAAVREATGSGITPYGAMGLAAWRGQAEQARPVIEAGMSDAVARGEGVGVTVAHWTSAVLFNGLGRHEEALAAARQAGLFPAELGAANWGLAELVEAAARTGAVQEGAAALEQLSVMALASGTDWALGVEARARALLSEGDGAERLYRDAIERLGRTRARAELARAHLVHGEWLRRAGRHLDAREQLRTAHEAFVAIGAEGFAERARRELLATGEVARGPVADRHDELTAQEAQIARLAAAHRTNSEIGAQLFISPRTVEWHLRKVFTKLGISSRRELAAALPPR